MRPIVFIALMLLAGCNCDPGSLPDDGGSSLSDSGSNRVDAGQLVDAGTVDVVDAGANDAGPGVLDAGSIADAGFGPVSVCPAPPDVVEPCDAGTADCDADPGTCETPTTNDAMNCGRCGRVCGATATCNASLCDATLVMNPDVSSNYCDALFTPDRLFSLTCWGNSDLSELRTAPIEPGTDVRGTSLVAYSNVSVVAMRGLTLDGPDVLFGLEGNPSRVFQVSASGSGPITTRFTTDAGTRFDGLQVVDDTYYWAHNTHTAAGQVGHATIKSRGRAGTQDTTLVAGLGSVGAFMVTPMKLIWAEVKSSGTLYGLYEAPRGGTDGDPTKVTLVAQLSPGTYVIRNGEFVYWADKVAAPNGRLRRYQFGHPNAVPQDIVTGLNSPEGLTSDGSYLYFKQADAMYRVGICGGEPEQLSPVVSAHDGQATQVYKADGTYVYWVAGAGFGDSQIFRVAK